VARFTGFFAVAIMLSLLIFIGEACATRSIRARRSGEPHGPSTSLCFDVRDSSVAFHQPSGTSVAVDHIFV